MFIFELYMLDTTGPDVPLFKKFKAHWDEIEDEIDKSKFKNGLFGKRLPKVLNEQIQDLDKHLNEIFTTVQPRDGYKELLLLCRIFLGLDVDNTVFYKPGAYHHARWMSKMNYALKIYIFRKQFKFPSRRNG